MRPKFGRPRRSGDPTAPGPRPLRTPSLPSNHAHPAGQRRSGAPAPVPSPAVVRRLTAVVLAALALAGCGGNGDSGSTQPATIAIDFTPNAVHAPIYAAARNGYDRKHGIKLTIRGPGTSPDSLKL